MLDEFKWDHIDFENDLAIDPDELDEEWLKHPMLFAKYSNMASDLERIAKKAHEHVKVTRSRLIRNYKKKEPKATQQQVEGHYREHPDHLSAKEIMIDAEYDHSMARNAVFAFTHRRQALENLVKLILQDWFSAPRDPKVITGGKRLVDMKRSETSEKVRAATQPRSRTRTRSK